MEKKTFYKKHETDKVWWVANFEQKGTVEFSFDTIKIYNLFRDYPQKLTKEEKYIFDKEYPLWKNLLNG